MGWENFQVYGVSERIMDGWRGWRAPGSILRVSWGPSEAADPPINQWAPQ
jgi:hypothetical protein